MRGADSTTATKRRYSTIPQSSSAPIHHSKSSSSEASRKPSSKLMDISMDDLPYVLLVEILCRLPCYKLIFQCKCVSKRWCTILSDPYFIGHFLCLQSDRKQTPVVRTIINGKGEEFLNRMSSSSKPLAPLFKRLMSYHGLKKEPVVLGTYHDLVLCCATEYDQRDYYICNPFTIQWVSLPPPPQIYWGVAVGFICDLPYNNGKKDDQKKHVIDLNAGYRCRVVRVCVEQVTGTGELKVQIFSSETGEWIEAIVSTPSVFDTSEIVLNVSFAYNGMLYFEVCDPIILIGIDPFMINNVSTSLSSTNSDDTIHHYKCRFTELDESFCVPKCMGVYGGGCLRMCEFGRDNDSSSPGLFVWDLSEEHEDEMVKIHGGGGKLCLQKKKSFYSLDEKIVMIMDGKEPELVAFDPNNEDILYVAHGGLVMCNIRTRECSEIVGENNYFRGYVFPLELPWWPTPVPRLLQHASSSSRAC